MEIRENPFTSKTFVETWLAHFPKESGRLNAGFIENISFYKHRLFPLWINLGRNLTKGISYELNPGIQEPSGRHAFLIYDVPTYFQTPHRVPPEKVGCYKIRQYPGYLIDLAPFGGLEEYLQHQFSKPTRYKMKKYRKRLEAAFDIEYVTYFGQIERNTYDLLFQHFRSLLEKRFKDKEIYNNNLDASEWDFYRDVAYPMILEKMASLMVIYAGGVPVAITLNYLNDDILFDAITVFDIDYSKFHIGSITILAQIEWCFTNNRNILDFSKGHFEYKEKWATRAYQFEYHLYFFLNQPISRLTAWSMKSFLALKQKLREWKLNEQWHRLTYRFRQRGTPGMAETANALKIENWAEPIETANLDRFDTDLSEQPSLKMAVFDFLYLYQEHIGDVSLYQSRESQGVYFIRGKANQARLTRSEPPVN